MAFAITLMEHVFVPKEDLGNFAMKVSLLIDYLTIQLKPRCNLAGVRNLVNLSGCAIFLGFTGTFFINSEWGSTQNVLMIVLLWSKQISRNCTHLLPNTRSTHTVKIFSLR